MANENFSPTSNQGRGNLTGGVSSAEDGAQIVLRLDPTTKRLLVDTSISSYTGVTDGEAVNAADTGTLILGTDGSNYQVLAVDSSGNLQVDVLTMPTTTVTATNLDIRDIDAASDDIAVHGSVGVLQQAVGGDLKVTLDSESVAVTGTFWQATQPVSAASLPLPSGAATSALQLPDGHNVTVDNATGAAAVNIQDGGNAITVDGTVTVGSITAGDNNIGNVDIVSLPAGNLGQQLAAASLSTVPGTNIADATYIGDIKFGESLPAGTAAIGKLAANSGVDIGDVDILTIAAGDNNIGNVDIVSLPAGNLGMQLMAASLSTVPASNITDATYIGDIKFGESLPAGTAAIGKLAANSGVDIGDVDILSIAAGDNNIGNVDLASAIPAGTNAIGKLLPPDIDVTAHTNYARKYYTNAGAVTDGIIWSPGAGKRWHVVTMYIQTSAAATVTLEDDKGAGDDPVWKGELAANGGAVLSFTEQYPMASGEDAADLLVTTSAGNIYITCVGYEI